MQGANANRRIQGNDILECRRRSLVLSYMSHDDVRVTHVRKVARCPALSAPLRKSEELNELHVQRVLGEIGQSVRPMSEARRDGRKILGKSAKGLVICYWDAKPLKLAGPIWWKRRKLIAVISTSILPAGSIPLNSNCWTMQH